MAASLGVRELERERGGQLERAGAAGSDRAEQAGWGGAMVWAMTGLPVTPEPANPRIKRL
jgi:hypothetical protein